MAGQLQLQGQLVGEDQVLGLHPGSPLGVEEKPAESLLVGEQEYWYVWVLKLSCVGGSSEEESG